MFSSVDLTIGTGAQHVFRLGTKPPEYLAQISRPTFLTRANGNIYGVSEVGHGKIFRIGGAAPTGAPGGGITIGGVDGAALDDGIAGEPISSGGSHPCHIAAAPDGRWLYVTNYGDGTLRAVRLTEGGEFGETVDLAHTGSGPVADRQSGPHAHFSAVVDDHLIVADLGTDELRVYPLESGRPAPDPILVAMPAGSGPRHFLRRGNALLVAGELDGTVTEVELGSWRVVRTAPAATAPGEHYLSHIAAADGMIVVGVRGSNTLSVLDSGLEIVQEVPTAPWPRHFAVCSTPKGSGVFVAGERSDEVVYHPMDLGAGQANLEEIADRVKVPTPMFIGAGEEF